MRQLAFCIVFVLLGLAGWAASGVSSGGAFVWLDTSTDTTSSSTDTTTTTDTTLTSTSTTTDSTTTVDSTTTTTTTVPPDNPPSFQNVPQPHAVEANGQRGAAVKYTSPTAVDDNDGPRPVNCSPATGSTFPLGDSPVTCTATDSAGHQGQVTFTVTVHDTTPPALLVPAPHSVYATSVLGVSDSDPAVIAFVHAASATDIVDPHPLVGTDLHSFLPVGETVIRFFAHDFSGNSTTRDVVLTVLPPPPIGAPPLPPPVVASPPPDVTDLSVTARDGALQLVWQIPLGVDHVVVTRSGADGQGTDVYSGKGNSYEDVGLENGIDYRYVIRSVDAAGNRSAGVAIVTAPVRNMLRSPKDGARLKTPPKLAWARESGADYYNIQLFRNGARIFVAWPSKTALALKSNWKYRGRTYVLKPGRYQWYVWPGFGSRKDVNYGALLGARSFLIQR